MPGPVLRLHDVKHVHVIFSYADWVRMKRRLPTGGRQLSAWIRGLVFAELGDDGAERKPAWPRPGSKPRPRGCVFADRRARPRRPDETDRRMVRRTPPANSPRTWTSCSGTDAEAQDRLLPAAPFPDGHARVKHRDHTNRKPPNAEGSRVSCSVSGSRPSEMSVRIGVGVELRDSHHRRGKNPTQWGT